MKVKRERKKPAPPAAVAGEEQGQEVDPSTVGAWAPEDDEAFNQCRTCDGKGLCCRAVGMKGHTGA